ncbi:DUF1127 domain-containing protein [Mesorhizobium sp. BR1-1-2]|uniref:DUF1127 domain-containing protein n=1 Tax=Mesorhizobium sp. BR1-1-2 TaxID=2876652 RepID=UPI001CCC573D|nr:DUF1127 domain-containing protein [Mesorhizobium sp. BR1-1-2]MBZ9963076.1 DUF1127 domain-containing protein [Mesorhizobium sp. BR1-1-2]
MVTILYIASNDESIHMHCVEETVQFAALVERKWIQSRQSARQVQDCSDLPRDLWAAAALSAASCIMVKSLGRWIDGLLERRRSRLALLDMADDQLKDIGISRCDAHREGIRPFWE